MDAVQNHFNRLFNSPVFLNLKAGRYEWEEVRAVTASWLFIVFLFCAVRGRRLSLGSLFWYYWFMIVGLLGIFVESYWLLFTDRAITGRSLLDVAIRLYSSTLDSRILGKDVNFHLLSSLCTFLTAPLSLLVSHSIQQQSAFQYPAQLIVSSIRMAFHAFFLLSNLSVGFTHCSGASDNYENGAEDYLQSFHMLPVQMFVGFHLIFILLSAVSIFRSLYRILQGMSACSKRCQ